MNQALYPLIYALASVAGIFFLILTYFRGFTLSKPFVFFLGSNRKINQSISSISNWDIRQNGQNPDNGGCWQLSEVAFHSPDNSIKVVYTVVEKSWSLHYNEKGHFTEVVKYFRAYNPLSDSLHKLLKLEFKKYKSSVEDKAIDLDKIFSGESFKRGSISKKLNKL